MPIQFDECFWAVRFVALGVAPWSDWLRGLTAARLTAALVRATTVPSYRRRAQALATRIRAEDKVAPVLNAVNRLAG